MLPGGIFYYHMDDPYIDVSEERSEEEIFEEILGKLKMDGLVNAKTEVIDAMDRDLTGTSVVLPVGRKRRFLKSRFPCGGTGGVWRTVCVCTS